MPLRRTWHLDAKRSAPKLGVTRKQVPVMPAFAMTAHGAQGQTLPEGVIADLVLGVNASVLTAYVAITRVTERARLLILRAFQAEIFQQGDKSFRSLLLRHWRQHDINWEEVLEAHVRTRNCSECKAARIRRDFTAGNWKCPTDDIVCRECTRAYRERGTPFRCCRCCMWRPQAAFRQPVTNINMWRSVCDACVEKRECDTCGLWLQKAMFAKGGWRRKRNRTCAVCQNWLRYLSIAQSARQRLKRTRRAQLATESLKKRKDLIKEIWAEVKRCKRINCLYCKQSFNSTVSTGITSCPHCEKLQAIQDGAPVPDVVMRTYRCPTCGESVESARTHGQVDARRQCGHRFTVERGKVRTQATQPPKTYIYTCPFCHARATTTTRNGRVDNRRACGHQFTVAEGLIVEDARSQPLTYKYRCPLCQANVTTTTRDGRVDNRRACGHQFTVAEGLIVEDATSQQLTYKYRCPLCQANVTTTTRDGRVDNRRACGHRFTVAEGLIVEDATSQELTYKYRCPLCQASVTTTTRDGRVDNRRACGHRFTVAEGLIVEDATSQQLTYKYRCPLCQANVTTTTRDGRVDNRRACGHQFTVAEGLIVEDATSQQLTYKYRCPLCQANVTTTTRDGRVDNRRACGHQFTVAEGVVVQPLRKRKPAKERKSVHKHRKQKAKARQEQVKKRKNAV